MSNGSLLQAEIHDLVDAVCECNPPPEALERLESLLLTDDEACRYCLEYLSLHGALMLADGSEACQMTSIPEQAAVQGTEGDTSFSPIVLDVSGGGRYPSSESFVGGPVFSYMVATLVLCMMLLGAWAYKISLDAPIATNEPAPSLIEEDASRFVARITGAKDCQWPDDAIVPVVSSYVSLGRKYSLDAGLLEITYKSGARVILEGPCVYTLDSDAGGYLAVGKLTARVKSGGLAASAASAKPQAANPQPPLFSVTTPTAVVTDLGTEFGVEVDESGSTTSHVFRGSVKVRTLGGKQKDVVLRADESARVEKGKSLGEVRLLTADAAGTCPTFVRRLREPLGRIDLLDIVAGGDGTRNQRGCGIDPVSGRRVEYIADKSGKGDGQYRLTTWNRLIDGVFLPDGMFGAVQVNSNGDVFDGFPETKGRSWGPVWVRAADDTPLGPDDDVHTWIHLMDHVERFTPERRGLLCLHANAGITFDLDALRRLYHWTEAVRFQSTAGMIDSSRTKLDYDGTADIWVIVDGKLKTKRIGLGRKDGAVAIDVEITPTERFLTLATTDGGDGITADWVVFGDPSLKTTPRDEEKQ